VSGAYGIGAEVYYLAGFSPLPAKGKLLMVSGVSGRHPMASQEKIEYWTRVYGYANIALRLPDNVIALDVDAYKDDLVRLDVLQEQLGPLPNTWNSDSRGGVGGKLLYRVPPGMKWQSSIGGITIVQHTHRYVMAMPSYNRMSDSNYMWYNGLDGEIVPDYQIPSIDDLTEFPLRWVKATEKHETQKYYHLEPQDVELDMFNDGEPCPYTLRLREICIAKLRESYASGLHDSALSITGTLMMAASNGHIGIPSVITELGAVFQRAPRNRDLVSEWFNIVDFVLANIEIDNVSEFDSCNLKLELEYEDDFRVLQKAGLSLRQISRRLHRSRRNAS
jgi:Bifunctional DNA primase/polymerase, N-terminal.